MKKATTIEELIAWAQDLDKRASDVYLTFTFTLKENSAGVIIWAQSPEGGLGDHILNENKMFCLEKEKTPLEVVNDLLLLAELTIAQNRQKYLRKRIDELEKEIQRCNQELQNDEN